MHICSYEGSLARCFQRHRCTERTHPIGGIICPAAGWRCGDRLKVLAKERQQAHGMTSSQQFVRMQLGHLILQTLPSAETHQHKYERNHNFRETASPHQHVNAHCSSVIAAHHGQTREHSKKRGKQDMAQLQGKNQIDTARRKLEHKEGATR